MEKQCTKCNLFKQTTEFNKDSSNKSGFNYWCKECSYNHRLLNKDAQKIKAKIYNENNKDKIRKSMSEWYNKNKEEHLVKSKKWRIENPNYFKEYLQNNKQARYEYKKYKYDNDIQYRLRIKIRDRLIKALKQNAKKGKTIELLGCSIVEYKLYLESKFTPEMSWSNYGKLWEIDHIIPCASFDLTKLEEQQKCFHYTNTQPLTVSENRSKGDTML